MQNSNIFVTKMMRVVLILFLVCESCNSEYTFEFIYGGKYGFQLNKIILASQHLGSLTLDIYQEGTLCISTTETWGPSTKYQVDNMKPLHLTWWVFLK